MGLACSLCGTTLDTANVSHGGRLCGHCSQALPPLAKSLESTGAPGAALSRDLTVVLTNKLFCGIAELCGDEAVGLQIGLALGCKHAEETGACAQADACDFCWLRRSIEVARISGERLHGIPLELATAETHGFFRLSVQRAGAAILLEMVPQPALAFAAGGLP